MAFDIGGQMTLRSHATKVVQVQGFHRKARQITLEKPTQDNHTFIIIIIFKSYLLSGIVDCSMKCHYDSFEINQVPSILVQWLSSSF